MDKVVKHRRHLHENPELSFKEYETADYIEAVLRELPGIRVWPRIGKTGIVAELGDSTAVKCVALRADMDALPIVETTNLEFRSTVAGVSHACGHDGHVAMLLSTAEELTKCHLKTCRVRLIFQPAVLRNCLGRIRLAYQLNSMAG